MPEKKNQNTKCPGWNSSLQKGKQSDEHSRFTKWFYETGYYRMTVKSDIYSGQDPFTSLGLLLKKHDRENFKNIISTTTISSCSWTNQFFFWEEKLSNIKEPIYDISTLTVCKHEACGMDHTLMVVSADPVKPRSWNKYWHHFQSHIEHEKTKNNRFFMDRDSSLCMELTGKHLSHLVWMIHNICNLLCVAFESCNDLKTRW